MWCNLHVVVANLLIFLSHYWQHSGRGLMHVTSLVVGSLTLFQRAAVALNPNSNPNPVSRFGINTAVVPIENFPI